MVFKSFDLKFEVCFSIFFLFLACLGKLLHKVEISLTVGSFRHRLHRTTKKAFSLNQEVRLRHTYALTTQRRHFLLNRWSIFSLPKKPYFDTLPSHIGPWLLFGSSQSSLLSKQKRASQYEQASATKKAPSSGQGQLLTHFCPCPSHQTLTNITSNRTPFGLEFVANQGGDHREDCSSELGLLDFKPGVSAY